MFIFRVFDQQPPTPIKQDRSSHKWWEAHLVEVGSVLAHNGTDAIEEAKKSLGTKYPLVQCDDPMYRCTHLPVNEKIVVSQ